MRVVSRGRWSTAVLLAAVGVAYADSSIVVLALPQLLSEFTNSVSSVAWVVTSFNVAVAVVALLLAGFSPRLRAGRMTTIGLALFLSSSVGCALAPSLAPLVAARTVQGVGAALLLSGALPALVQLGLAPGLALAAWSAATAFGAAVGPALGGLLTQAFSWRSIFFAQIPLAVAALAVLVRLRERGEVADAARDPDPTALSADDAPPRGAGWAPPVALALLFGALVGLLFLVVLLLIDVWDLSPLAAAGVATTIPVATLAVRPLGRALSWPVAAGGGCLLTGLCLAAVAALNGRSVWVVVVALAVGGAGLGLAGPGLTRHSLHGGGLLRTAGHSVSARHVGLVLGLAVAAPLLAGPLDTAKQNAVRAGADALFAAPLPVDTQLAIGIDLLAEVQQAPSGHLPDFAPAFVRHGASSNAEVRHLYAVVQDGARQRITRSFRPALVYCGALATGAFFVCLVGTGRRRGQEPGTSRRRRMSSATASMAALTCSGFALVAVVTVERPADLVGRPPPDPCAQQSATLGLAPTERIVLESLSSAACTLHTTDARVLLVLTDVDPLAAGSAGKAGVDAAVRRGLRTAADGARARGDISASTAAFLDTLARFGSLDGLVNAFQQAGGP